jgi:hypothetical protein
MYIRIYTSSIYTYINIYIYTYTYVYEIAVIFFFLGSNLANSKRPRDAVIKEKILKGQYKIDDNLSAEAKVTKWIYHIYVYTCIYIYIDIYIHIYICLLSIYDSFLIYD